MQHSSASSSAAAIGSYIWAWTLALAVITLLLFKPILGYDFVNWDDDVTVQKNQFLDKWDKEHLQAMFTRHVNGNYNPLTIFSFAVDVHILGYKIEKGGEDFHRQNWILHTANTVLVFLLFCALGLPPWAAFFGALLFGIHPMRVESVAWVTERKDVLFGFFYLLCLWLYARFWRGSQQWGLYVLLLLLAVLAGLSKIQAVSLPLSMLAIDYLLRRKKAPRLVLEKIPFFAVSLAIGLTGIYFLKQYNVLQNGEIYSFPQRVVLGAYTLCVYLIKAVYPYEMSPLYGYKNPIPAYFYLGIFGMMAFFALCYWLWKSDKRPFLFGLLFFFVNVMFMLQILSAGQGFLADRFTYIAYIGIFFIFAVLLERGISAHPSQQGLYMAAAAVYVLLLGYRTAQYMKVWKNSETLWTHAIAVNPDKLTTPYNSRGSYRLDKKQYDKAIVDFNKSLDIKQDGKVYNDRGVAYFSLNDIEKAFTDFNKGIELSPEYAPLYVSRGAIYGAKNNFPAALQDLNKGLELDSTQEKGYMNRGLLHYLMQNYEAAIKDHSSRIRLLPQEAEIYYQRALCYNLLSRPALALADLDRAAALDRRNFGAIYAERAKAHLMLGNKAQAKADADKAQAMGQQIDAALLQAIQ